MMNGEATIRGWIQQLATGQNAAYYEQILEQGEAFDQIARKVSKRRHFKMDNKTQGKGSYANSQRFAQAYPGVRYYEGYRYCGIVVVEFAWNVVNGEVVEWVNSKEVDEIPPVYFGVEIPVEFLRQNIGKEIVIPEEKTPHVAVPVTLDLGTPLLGWYWKLRENGLS